MTEKPERVDPAHRARKFDQDALGAVGREREPAIGYRQTRGTRRLQERVGARDRSIEDVGDRRRDPPRAKPRLNRSSPTPAHAVAWRIPKTRAAAR